MLGEKEWKGGGKRKKGVGWGKMLGHVRVKRRVRGKGQWWRRRGWQVVEGERGGK